jgi:hypothetical protein
MIRKVSSDGYSYAGNQGTKADAEYECNRQRKMGRKAKMVKRSTGLKGYDIYVKH